MFIWPAFHMGQYRVNDHPYHAPQFIIFTQTYSVGTWSEQTLSSNSTVYDSGRLILFFNFRPDSRSIILGAFSNIFLLQCRSLDTSSAGILLSGLGVVGHFIFLGVLVRNEPDEFLNKRMNTAPPTDITTGVIWKSNSC